MYAAEEGHSTLGIPQSVGAEFVKADPGGALPAHAPDRNRLKRAMMAGTAPMTARKPMIGGVGYSGADRP
jgi:hypothetical protein